MEFSLQAAGGMEFSLQAAGGALRTPDKLKLELHALTLEAQQCTTTAK